jgi:hypothetical protein
MATNNVLVFTAPMAPLSGRRAQMRPADVISLRSRRARSRRRLTGSVLCAAAALLVWAGAIVLGFAAFKPTGDGVGDVLPGWLWWPAW